MNPLSWYIAWMESVYDEPRGWGVVGMIAGACILVTMVVLLVGSQ